ncbi:MAG: transglycosylase domain-containing protein [Deltaproteobacteria bacterium]|nr:transglycosylase domain-containing protein [Deltaproteobacteria bacterium]
MKSPGFVFYRIILLSLAVVFFSGLVGVLGLVYYYGHDLPRRLDLTNYQPPVVSTVYDVRGRPIGEFYHQRRIVVPLDRIPSHVIQAFLAAEDARFFTHKGVDGFAILRAFFANLRKGGAA